MKTVHILDHTTIYSLDMIELSFENQKRMLHYPSDGRFSILNLLIVSIDFLHFFIGEVEPILQERRSEHDLNIDQFTAADIVIVIQLNYFNPMGSGNHFIHGAPKNFPFGFPPTVGVFNLTK